METCNSDTSSKSDFIQIAFDTVVGVCVFVLFLMSLCCTFAEYIKSKSQKQYSKPSCSHR